MASRRPVVRVNRPTLCDSICRKIRITRKKPGYPSFTKRELLHIESFINATVTELQGTVNALENKQQSGKHV